MGNKSGAIYDLKTIPFEKIDEQIEIRKGLFKGRMLGGGILKSQIRELERMKRNLTPFFEKKDK